jgi:phosphoribosylaminoimidazolecarboxamide formyltransferase/IMP cyclohydrolase
MMNEFQLKYGTNPNQKPARIFMKDGSDLPVTVLNGRPGYINFLDALNSWQLVRDLRNALGMPAAASFKHVSPAGAAVGNPLDETLRKMYQIAPEMELSPLACAYARARGADRMSSFGDWIALSDRCDRSTALLIKKEVSDGIIAPGYDDDALAILKEKKKGAYNVVAIDPDYVPEPLEQRQVFGVTFEQGRQDLLINADTMLGNIVTAEKDLTDAQKRDLVMSLIVLKYTQSNSVCYVQDGQTIGVGAGQQSRIHCTRLAGEKADRWQLRHMPKVLDLPFRPEIKRPDRDNAIDVFLGDTPEDVLGDAVWANTFTVRPEPLSAAERRQWLDSVTDVALGSDAFFPFGDNIERAHRSGVTAIVEPGGSIRDDHVIETCNRYGIVMAFCGIRLFHH